MKKNQTIGFLVALLFFAISAAAQNNSPEQLVVSLSNPGKPYSLSIRLTFGSIKVIGYAGKEIVIEAASADKSKTTNAEDGGNGMKRIFPPGGYDITATENNNSVTIGSSHNKHVSLVIKIPQDVKLKLATVNDGAIEVDNVKGELEVNNVNGAIKLTNISGAAVASTVNGNVTAGFISISNTPMAFSTLNGNVDVSFPADAKANLKLKSDRGEIYTDFDMAIDQAEQKSIKTSESGMQRIKVDDWIKGRINGGGAEMLMKNMNGNIYVRKIK